MNTVETLHTQVWSRFLHKPYGIVLDYADQDGNAIIPTPEECVRSMPNPLGWWTPIENGAFFTGLYLGGLTEAFRLSPSEKLKNEILTLIGGLFRLQDVGNTPGFIARGVATDGTSHYPMGSDDQTAPWVYGLYKALQCDFFNERTENRNQSKALAGDTDFGEKQLACSHRMGRTIQRWIYGTGFPCGGQIAFSLPCGL